MFIILFAWDWHPQYKLVVAANRDEFYRRPTSQAAIWDDYPQIIAGRDLQAGGTWMGITRSGRFAALTNYRDPFNHIHNAPSRGLLVQNYLTGHQDPESYIDALEDGGRQYNSFNLLLGNHEALFYFSNREGILRQVSPGIHGLSNSLLDVPWPKVCKGTRLLTEVLQQPTFEAEDLFAILRDREYPADEELPDTGVGLKMERMLGPIFVESSEYNYGTRVSTIVLIGRDNKVQFWERSYTPLEIDNYKQVYYEFQLQKSNSCLKDLPNIGKQLEKRLASIGVNDSDTLTKLGSKEAFLRLKQVEGDTCYNTLCSLEGAIQGIRWHHLSSETKQDLKEFFNRNKT